MWFDLEPTKGLLSPTDSRRLFLSWTSSMDCPNPAIHKGNATLSWEFLYETNTNTMPYGVIYKAMYDEHDYCNDTEEYFQNV